MKTIIIDEHVMPFDSTDNRITFYECLSENAIGNLEYCPCAIVRDESTKCPCESMKQSPIGSICDCRLYKKVEELNI